MITTATGRTPTRPPRRPPPPSRPEAAAWRTSSWCCSVVTGAPRTPGTVLAVGSLPAVSLLVGMVRRSPSTALVLTLLGATAVVAVPQHAARERLTLAAQGQFLSYLAADLVLGVVVATRTRRVSVVAVTLALGVQSLVIGLFAHGPGFLVVDGSSASSR